MMECHVLSFVVSMAVTLCASDYAPSLKSFLYFKYFQGYFLPVNYSAASKIQRISKNGCAVACSEHGCAAFAFRVDKRECVLLPNFVSGDDGSESDSLWKYFARPQEIPDTQTTNQMTTLEDTTQLSTTVERQCPVGYTKYVPDNTCFKVVASPGKTRTDAVVECQKDAGNLIVINSLDEFQAIDPYLRAGNQPKYYIGLEKDGGQWVTWNKDPVPWINWENTQPNDPNNQFFAALYTWSLTNVKYEMHDTGDSGVVGYICETNPQ